MENSERERLIAQNEKELKAVRARIGDITLRSLGESLLAWSNVEAATEMALNVLLVSAGMSEEPAKLVASNSEGRDRASVLLALSFRLYGDQCWHDPFVTVINEINNDLRNRRNRLFHDAWSLEDGEIKRRAGKTKLIKPQARKLDLYVPDFEPMSASEIHNFIRDCLDAATRVLAFSNEVVLTERHKLSLRQSIGRQKSVARRLADRLLKPRSPPQSSPQ